MHEHHSGLKVNVVNRGDVMPTRAGHVVDDLFCTVVSCGVTAAQCGAWATAAVLLAAAAHG